MITRVSADTWEFPDGNIRIRKISDRNFLTVRRSGGPGYPATSWVGAFNIGLKLFRSQAPDYTPAKPEPERAKTPTDYLLPRERQALGLLVEAMSDKEIAAAMGVSVPTAKQYVEGVIRKLCVRNRTAAAVWGARNIPPETHRAAFDAAMVAVEVYGATLTKGH